MAERPAGRQTRPAREQLPSAFLVAPLLVLTVAAGAFAFLRPSGWVIGVAVGIGAVTVSALVGLELLNRRLEQHNRGIRCG
jgi:hypothetical protein